MVPNEVIPIDRHRPRRLRDLAAAFLASKARALGPSSGRTIQAYRRDLERFLAAFGDRPPDLDASEVERYLLTLAKSDGSPVAPATAARHHAALSSFFTWLVEQEQIERSPMKKIKKTRVKEPPTGALSPALEEQLLRQAKEKDVRVHALLLLLVRTGLRISEALALDVRDLRLDELAIDVRSGKGDKQRQVFLTTDAKAALKRLLRGQPSPRPYDPVFTSQRGRLSYQRAAALFKAVAGHLRNSDGSELHLHQLRHTFCTTQLLKGMNPAHLMTLAGHADLRTLGRYVRAAQTQAAEDDFRRHNS